MAKKIILDDDDADSSPDSVESLVDNDSEAQPTQLAMIDAAGTKLDPSMQAISQALSQAEPDDASMDDESPDSDADSPSTPTPPPDKLSQLQTMLAQATGKSPVESRMNTGDAITALLGNKQQELSSAQSLRNNLQLLAGLTHAGQTAGAALAPLSRVKPDEQAYNTAMAQSQQPVSDVMQKQALEAQQVKDIAGQQALQNEMAKEKPDSDISKLYNQIAQQTIKKANLNIKLPDGLSASNIEKIMPGIENMANRHEQAAMRQAIAEQNNITKQALLSGQQDKVDEKTQQAFGKDLNTLDKSSRSVIGRSAGAKVAIQRLTDIVNDPQATNQDLNNAYTDMTAVIAGASPAMGAVAHNSYNTLQNQMAEMKQFWTSQPQAPIVPGVKAHMIDLANRMQDISNGVINQHLGTVASKYSGWMSRHPDDAKDMINKASGVEVTPYIPLSSSKKSNGVVGDHPQDAAAISWAKANPNDPRSAKILQANGISMQASAGN